MNAAKMLEPVLDRFQSEANVKTVFGEPFEAHGKTYVPVATVAYGFGGGAGREEGSGLGGGLRAKPAGVLEISDGEARFIRFEPIWKHAGAVAFGLVLGLRIGRRLAHPRR